MAREPPELPQKSPVISTTTGFAVNHGLRCDPGLQHTTPAAQILQGHADAVRHRKLSGTAAAQPCLQAGQGAHQHPLYRHLLLLSDQQMTGLMNSDPPQPPLAARQGLRQHMPPHALPAGGINAEHDQATANGNHNPGRRQTQHRPEGSKPRDGSHHQTRPKRSGRTLTSGCHQPRLRAGARPREPRDLPPRVGIGAITSWDSR